MTDLSFGVLFDMDGVIVDSNPAHKIAINLFCKNHNKVVDDLFMQSKIYGRTNQEWIPELFELALSELQLLEYANEKEQLFRDIFKSDLLPVAGVIEFIDHLNSHQIKIAVATSAPGENAEFILTGLKIKNRFEAILDASHVKKGKPNPDVYIKAAAAIGFAPKQCIVVEDSLAGVQAGKSAGCKVIGITTTHSREELNACDLVVDDFVGLGMKELRGIFRF